MEYYSPTKYATRLLGASVLAIGLAASAFTPAAAAKFQVLPAKAVTPDNGIVKAAYRSRGRSVRRVRRAARIGGGRRVIRSRYSRGYRYSRRYRRGNGAAAVLGAFGTIAAAAILANSHRQRRRVYYSYGYVPNCGYDYYAVNVGYGYQCYPSYRRSYGYYPAYDYGYSYVTAAPVYSGGYYYRRNRHGLARIIRRNRRIYAGPNYAVRPVYRQPRVLGRANIYRQPRVFRQPAFARQRVFARPARVFRGGGFNRGGAGRAFRRMR